MKMWAVLVKVGGRGEALFRLSVPVKQRKAHEE